jgi:hypothetical protein
MKKITITLALFLLLIGAGCATKDSNGRVNTPPEGVMCTQEAMECPDGSYVGRTGPNCEFAPCPNTATPQPDPTPSQQDNKNWKTITIGGVLSVQIPPHCNASAGAGSTHITCPTPDNETPIPEFYFSSDGTQVNMRRWEGLSSEYWDATVASLKILTPLNRAIQINIDK